MKLDVKKFSEAGSSVSRLTGAALVNLKLSKGRLRVSGENAGRSMTTFVELDSKDTFEVALDKAILDKTLKGRAQLDLVVEDNSTVKFSAKTYRVELQAQPYGEPPTLDRSGELKIDEQQQGILDHAIPFVSLVQSYAKTTVMFFASFTDQNSRVACLDNLHFALYQTIATERPLELVFPFDTFQTINDAAKKAEYTLSATASAICAWNKEFELLLPFVQQEADGTLDDMSEMAAEIKRGMAVVNVRELVQAINSATSTCESGDPVTLTLLKEKGVVQISSKSSIGSVMERIQSQVRKSHEFSITPDLVLDLLTSIRTDEAEIGVHAEKYFFARTVDDEAEILYGCLLPQTT